MMPAIFLIVPIGSRSKKGAHSRRIGTALGLLLLVVVLINGCGGKPRTPLADRPGIGTPRIGTPVDLGKNFSVVFGAGGTVSMTTTAAAPAGGSNIVMAADRCVRSCPQLFSVSCTDSAGNSYTTDVSIVTDGVDFQSICSSHHLAAALPAGSTITASFNGPVGSQGLVIRAIAVIGLASAPLDRTASAGSFGATPSSGNAATTTAADELLVGEIFAEQLTVANAGFMPGSGYTALAGVDGPGGLFGEYEIVSATGVYAADGTFASGTTSPWGALLATYKAAPP